MSKPDVVLRIEQEADAEELDSAAPVRHYTPKQVAEILSLTPTAVLRLCKENRLTHLLIPGNQRNITRIPETALKAWIKERTHAG